MPTLWFILVAFHFHRGIVMYLRSMLLTFSLVIIVANIALAGELTGGKLFKRFAHQVSLHDGPDGSNSHVSPDPTSLRPGM